MQSRPLRKYESFWNMLKEHGNLKLHCHPAKAYTLRRMLMKEKNLDHVFHLSETEKGQPRVLKFDYRKEDQVMKIKLEERIRL